MDLNFIYQRYGVALRMAANAACQPSRAAHLQLAKGYAAKIATARLHGSTTASQ